MARQGLKNTLKIRVTFPKTGETSGDPLAIKWQQNTVRSARKSPYLVGWGGEQTRGQRVLQSCLETYHKASEKGEHTAANCVAKEHFIS